LPLHELEELFCRLFRWQRFQTAKQQVESEETWGKRFTQEDLNDRTGLSLNTLACIFKRELGVECQFNRLSEAEGKILFWFAIYREPVAIAKIRKSVVGSASGRSVPQQVNSLIRRSLIEKIDGLFFLQPVVMELVTERLIQQVCTEFATRQLDVLQSHSLIRVQAKDYVLLMQLRLIVQPVMEWLLSCYRNVAEVEDRARLLLAQQRQKSGYVAGNLINLLVQIKVDLRGSDFSELLVWQADLLQVNLAGVNFENADLTESVL
jgi:hypothetical protein